MKDIKKRLITGCAIFIVFLGVILLSLLVHWLFFDIFVLLLSVVAAFEVIRAIGAKYPKPLPVIAYLAIVLGYTAYILSPMPAQVGGITLFYCVILALCLAAIIYSLCSKKVSTNNVVATMFVMIYPISVLMYLIGINHFAEPYRADVMLLLFAVAPLTDTFAFFVGSLIKGKKLCPKISPNKTISGAVGGLIGGTLGGVLLYFVSLTGVGEFFGMGPLSGGVSNCINFICLGLLCSFATQIGDLFASYIKRMVGIKDYGKILPGHGGVMDRIDGLLFGCLAVYLYASVLMAI